MSLLTKYEIHKCSNYCKIKKRYIENVFVTKCKFGFPRPTCENIKESMKSEKKIYHVKRSEEEVRINDYNLQLLLLWQANIDVQFINEASLALAE